MDAKIERAVNLSLDETRWNEFYESGATHGDVERSILLAVRQVRLATYIQSRGQGKTHDQAMKAAQKAGDRIHGMLS